MKKNDIIQMEINSISSDGNGVGRYEGMAVFVPKTAAGDIISCRIVKVCKRYAFGIIDTLVIPSPLRTDKRSCAVFGKCGGCLYRHMTYDAECAAKEKNIRDAFSHLGKLDVPFDEFIPCDNSDGYRNKAQYPLAANAEGKTVFGFYAPRSHRVIPCGDCRLQPPVFADIAADICSFIDEKKISVYNEENGKGVARHIYLRQGHYSGEIMVCVVVTAFSEKFRELAPLLTEKYTCIKSIVLNINPTKNNVILGEKCVTLWGSDCISDTMCGNVTELSPLSFYQVNTPQAERLYAKAAEYATLTGSETLLDLYCGAGTVGLSMAHSVKRLIGCEIVPDAVENAKKNAAANNIDNAEFFCADAAEAAEKFAAGELHPDVIVTDPPRKGCGEKTLGAMVKMSPERIVMISCNAATAAADSAFLAANGYRAVSLSGVDLFPGTGHVECVVLMSRIEK